MMSRILIWRSHAQALFGRIVSPCADDKRVCNIWHEKNAFVILVMFLLLRFSSPSGRIRSQAVTHTQYLIPVLSPFWPTPQLSTIFFQGLSVTCLLEFLHEPVKFYPTRVSGSGVDVREGLSRCACFCPGGGRQPDTPEGDSSPPGAFTLKHFIKGAVSS